MLPPLDRELRRTGVLARNEMPRAGLEIVEDVLLPQHLSGFVPRLAVLGAAAQIGEGKDAAGVKPQPVTQ